MEKKIHSRPLGDSTVKKPRSLRTLPNKKSSAFPGVWSQLPSTSHPVPHHASRTWNRRGQLRELRIRFYCEQQVLRKVFREWKEEWWISHREWKLCVRADCHYRYYLYSLMFQTWKTYVHQRQEMRNKYMRAEDYDAKRKIRQAWKSWLIYVVVRRTKLQMQTAALEFRQRNILWVWWSEWRKCLQQVRVGRALYASAMKHRALSLQLQAWSRWQEQLLCMQRDRHKVACALKHHEYWQKRSSLRAWFEYLQLRRVKRQRNEMAERFYRVTVLQTHFCDWQWAWEWRESLYAHRALVEVLARRMVLRRAFTHWKHYVLIRAEEAAQYKMAEEHCRHRLLTFYFRALKDNVARAHLQQIRRNLAHQQYEATLLRRFWGSWQSLLEQREEREQLSLLRAAWNHYRITLLHRCFKLWLQYTQKRRYKQLLLARADGHFQQRALPAAFQAWRRLWRWHQQENALNARAIRFHRELLGRQVFAIWWQKMSQHRENRLAERVAILHAEQWLLHRAWSTWQQQVAACHQERQKQAVACAHHRHWRVRRTFHVWRESARGLRTEKLGKARAVEFHRVQLLLWAWKRWRECLALCDAERQKLVRADLHHQHSLLHRVLRRWMTYQDRVRHVLQEVAARESQHKRQLLRGVLHRWRENTIACVDEAQKASQARDHYRRTMCSKVLAQWREAASMQIYCRQQEDCAVSEARGVLARGCVQAVFQRWRDRSQSMAQQRVQMERAAQHHRLRLLQEMMAQWKAHHLGFIRKMDSLPTLMCLVPQLLQRQGTRFLAQRLSQSCFYHWRRQLVARREEQQGTARALWFWSFSLQAKVIGVQDLEDRGFSPACGEESTWSGGWIGWASPLLFLEAWDAWLGFVLERRRKKARLEQAMQAYHHQLLQEGVTHLLRFAAGVKTSRQQLQAQKQAQAAHSLHRAVRRCAMLWKQKVLGPARQLLSPVPALPNRRVTFEVPFPSLITAGAGDAALETKRPEARPERGLGSLALAAGDPQLLELLCVQVERVGLDDHLPTEIRPSCSPRGTGLTCLPRNTARSARKQPRCPDFLLDPKQSQRPLGCTPFGGQGLRPEKAQEHSQGAAQPASDSLPRPFQVEAQTAPAPRNPLPQPGSLPRPRGRRLPSTASAGPELMLLPPSSFMLHGTETPARVSAPLQPHIPTSLAGAPDPHLLLPGDFTGTRACPGLGSEVAGGAELEVELEGIRQQLQHYQATKQNLWSCQRQASSLRRWLELSREEPRPEDQEAEQQMQKELEEVRSRAPHQPQGGSGSAPTQPAGHPLPTGGSTDPAPGCRAPGPTPACQCLHSPCPGPAAGPVLASLPRRAPAGLRGRLRPPPGTEHNRPQCSDVLFFYFFISNC
ncbi:protein SFI1 homolog isoform X7 [Loxodonta africana]|uniref:protein SFI1 homolog isoform X7 n=1 Tax=Loxodonta africana TaxID=9785 RepID=UPI0030CDED5C